MVDGRVWLHVAEAGQCVMCILCKGSVKEDLCEFWGFFFWLVKHMKRNIH